MRLFACATLVVATGCGGRTAALGFERNSDASEVPATGGRPPLAASGGFGEFGFGGTNAGAGGFIGGPGLGGTTAGEGGSTSGSAGSTGGTNTGAVIDPCAGVRCKRPVCPPGSSLVTLPGECCPSCSPVTPTPWTPANLAPGLVFWFDPTSLVQIEGLVIHWSDLSGNGNDASQTRSEYEPTYTASGINGLPSATFSGPITFLHMADNASIRWGTGDFAVFAVVRATAQTSVDAMIYQKTGAYPYDGASLYLNADKPVPSTLAAAQVSGGVYVVSGPPPATFVDGTVHVLGARRAGATLEVRIDGTATWSITGASIASVDVSAPGYDAIIGQNGYGSPGPKFQQVHGDIAEIVGTRGTMTEADAEALERYLKLRYGVP